MKMMKEFDNHSVIAIHLFLEYPTNPSRTPPFDENHVATIFRSGQCVFYQRLSKKNEDFLRETAKNFIEDEKAVATT